MAMQPAALFIDFDGTAVLSEPVHAEAHRTVLGRLQIPCDEDLLVAAIGRGDGWLYHRIAERHGLSLDVDALRRLKGEELLRRYRAGELQAAPGLADLLHRCRQRGIATMLVTSSDRESVHCGLGAIGLARALAMRVCAEDVSRLKPAPDSYLLAARRLTLPPGRCLVVEDSISGVTAATQAGMAVLAIRSAVPEESLLTAGALGCIDGMEQVLP
jgi:HAD superfamily hydrolase (TIGR01509 family)